MSNLLHTYNSNSPYVALNEWDGVRCKRVRLAAWMRMKGAAASAAKPRCAATARAAAANARTLPAPPAACVCPAARRTSAEAAPRHAATAANLFVLPASKTTKGVRACHEDSPSTSGIAKSPTLRFSPYAWAKLLFLRDLGETEVGGFGICRWRRSAVTSMTCSWSSRPARGDASSSTTNRWPTSSIAMSTLA